MVPEFTIRRPERSAPDSPEALFRQLRPRDPNVRDLYLRQGELLRKYTEVGSELPDVALELQTGAGKTLVGFLIAEFRRRKFGHRVAYLCPNVQLARQAAKKAHAYGLDVVTLVRAQRDWDPQEFLRYNRGESIAVATYSQVFNVNPKMDRTQTLILDDAHSGEDPVASMWSLAVERNSPAYAPLLGLISDTLPDIFRENVADDSSDPKTHWEVELISPTAWAIRSNTIAETLKAHLPENDPSRFRYRAIASHLAHCLAFVSWNEILIRPLIPPSRLWAPFKSATQRVYMSATIGQEGELERAFGVPHIEHLSVTAPSEELRFGRRFFFFPDAAYDKPDADAFTQAAIELIGRVLILTPSNAVSDSVASDVIPDGYPVIGADDVEVAFDAFTSHERAALVLANRYDGMDLPDDACRLIVIAGIPAQSHSLERFLLERLTARRMLSERIRTRFVQGAGRCTRNSRDYAAVLVRGFGLTNFWAKSEELKSCSPDLQAELEFGFDNAGQSRSDALDLLRQFLEQGSGWREADAAIREMAATARVESPVDAEALLRSASSEVEVWTAIWRNDLASALEHAERVLDALEGGSELRPYRALWLYLAACWAAQIATQTDATEDKARADSLRRDAQHCAGPLPWSPSFGDPTAPRAGVDYDESAHRAVDRLKQFGLHGTSFERKVAEAEAHLAGVEAAGVHQGLVVLGEMLGFEAISPSGSGAPDVAWRSQYVTVAFEAKTEESPEKPLALSAVRQARTHLAWIRDNLGWQETGRAETIIVGRHTRVGEGITSSVANRVALVSPKSVVEIFKEVADVHRNVRSRSRGASDEELRSLMGQGLRAARLEESFVIDRLTAQKVAHLIV